MSNAISGLTITAFCYGLLWVMRLLWSAGKISVWLRFPRGAVAWFGAAGLVLPVKGFADVVGELFTTPSTATAYSLGFYCFLMLLVALVAAHSDVIDFERMRPFLVDAFFFRPGHRNRRDIFVQLEQKKISDVYREQSGTELRFAAQRRTKHLSPVEAMSELSQVRKARQEEAGKTESNLLEAGETTDIIDIVRLFTLHQRPHPAFDRTFRVVVDPAAKTCTMYTMVLGVRPDQLHDAERFFRFQQDVIDMMQVFTSQHWMNRFRPFFETLAMECYEEVKDSFDMPKKRAFLRLAIGVADLDARKNKVFIATELSRIGTVTWLEGEPE